MWQFALGNEQEMASNLQAGKEWPGSVKHWSQLYQISISRHYEMPITTAPLCLEKYIRKATELSWPN